MRLGVPDGLVELLQESWPLFGSDSPTPEAVRERLRGTLGVPNPPAELDVHIEDEWQRDGLSGTELSWNAGFGERVAGRCLRPAGSEQKALPGVLFLHCHGGVKRFGLAKLADGADGRAEHPVIEQIRSQLYGGRPAAEDLARTGRVVLVHDGFGWGSRRMPLDSMPARSEAFAEREIRSAGPDLDEATLYDIHANPAEDAVAKALGILGTSWAGLLAREDLIAGQVLADLAPTGYSVMGLSGGGARAALATALGMPARAVVVSAMTSSLAHMLPAHVSSHTWALMTPGLGRIADWPQIIATAAPRPLLVQYARQDQLFPLEGMQNAHRQISEAYAQAGSTEAYTGSFHDAPHSFSPSMQKEAFDWLPG
ncbi:alpha/beta hydrolase family protein [Kineosporia babensis]|uniref:Uncharacterized protein n=1 Tax=Kineosporia babensis TaxID=499548 RepID=A0A9X1NMH6_9ACTN|nr:hypothetical protein [Kineosporia babensis]MCD5316456.1 hypothetical protein [Kineosporia babensis]